MNIEIPDEDVKLLATVYSDDITLDLPEGQALQRVCQQVRAQMPRPLKVGDIVHCDNDYAGDAKLVIKALGEDVHGPQAWCLDGDGYLTTYTVDSLRHGVRP